MLNQNFTTMKKLILFVCLFVAVGISANVMAQGTGVAPQVGTTHAYSVTNPTVGNDYLWSVTSDFAGSTSVVGTVATLSATTGSSINITWVNPVPGTTYFVHVVETATATSGCTNRKAIAVTPVNSFALEIVNVNSGDVEQAEDASVCPANVTITSFTAPQTFVYDYDAVVFYYKITASGINTTNTGWSPQFTVGTTNTTGATVTAGWATSIGGTYTDLPHVDGTTANDINVAANNPSIWVKVTVDNGASPTGLEGLTAQDVTVALLNAANTSEDANGNDVTSIGNGSRNQVVKARPDTQGITTTGL